jgi:single-stranded-DNA-specific exonuclease
MRWEYRKNDVDFLEKMREKLGFSIPLLKLLYNRGIREEGDIRRFLDCNFSKFRDPYKFERMEEAIGKIIGAKNNNKKIFIYGDYDVDGITATAFLTIVFRKLGIDVDYYIPNRMDNGYGLNREAIDVIYKNGGKLIITVDTGVNSLEDIRYARNLGIELIITDHHKLVEEDDDNVLIINPKLSNFYEFKFLSGAGVALKLAQALYIKLGIKLEKLYDYIDIVMIGTVADVVPMIDENRIIIKKGLELIKNTKVKGLVYLLRYLKFGNKELTTTDISFFISPLLNALGRVGDSKIGVDFFVEENEGRIYEIIEEMKKSNKKRRTLERIAFNEIDEKYRNQKDFNYIFEISEDWHPGIIGVIGSRLSLKYNVPVVLVTLKNHLGKGSCRSVEGVNIFDILNSMAKDFIRFGGHDLAAGFVIDMKKLPQIKKAIEDEISRSRESLKEKVLHIDFELSLEDINDELLEDFKKLSPFGLDNQQPLFLEKDLEFVATKKFGVEDRHFKTFIKKNGKYYSAVAFNLGDKIEKNIYPFQRFDIVYYPEKIQYKGEEILQIKIKDFQYKDEFYKIFN